MIGLLLFVLIAIAVSMLVNIFIKSSWVALIIATLASPFVWIKIGNFIDGRPDALDGLAMMIVTLPSFFIALAAAMLFFHFRDKKRLIWIIFSCLVVSIALTTFSQKRPLFHRLLVGNISPYSGLARELKSLPPSKQESYVHKCIKILKGSNEEEKAQAAYILGDIGLPLATPAIPALQETVKDPLAGDAASTALAQLGYNTQNKIEECLKVLESSATTEAEVSLHTKAIKSLAAIDVSSHRESLDANVPRLVRALLNTFPEQDSTGYTSELLLSNLLSRHVNICGTNPAVVSRILESSFQNGVE